MTDLIARYRTWLFAPASRPRYLAGALASDADAVILDLEDAVAETEKPAARAVAAEAVAGHAHRAVFVRVNALGTPHAARDIAAIVPVRPTGLILPMVETASDLAIADWALTQAERDANIDRGTTRLIPLIETARGIANAGEIAAASARTVRLGFGSVDYARDLGIAPTRTEEELAHPRTVLVLASRVAGIAPPIDAVWTCLDDHGEGLGASSARARQLGFTAKQAIHPAQLPAIRAAFAPSDAEIAHARRVIAAFAEAEAEGRAALTLDGAFVDYPVVEAARTLLNDAGETP